MQKISAFYLVIAFFAACSGNKKNLPDVSGIRVSLAVQRFDRDFFSMDTTQLDRSLDALQRRYPVFLRPYLEMIAGVTDSSSIKAFFRAYKPLYDSAQKSYAGFDGVKQQLENAFRYVKYYFPGYQVPATIIPVIGPMNSVEDLARTGSGDYTPDFLGDGFIGISLQFYLGSRFSLYSNEYFINNVAPRYRSRRFAKEYIAADVMKLVTDDIFPDRSSGKPLIEQMIEKGKQWWLLDKFLPEAPDSVKTGYTEQQLRWCRENEGLIWSYIVRNESLYSIDPATIQTYIGEAPFTSVFPQDASPGNIGAWIGWQIVSKFAGNNPALRPEAVMQTSAKQILEEAKYKPK
ncbi:MAG: hypothetical protein ABW019_15385 [Chitinophagaceae bacterium]